jgi:hypothetical protein
MQPCETTCETDWSAPTTRTLLTYEINSGVVFIWHYSFVSRSKNDVKLTNFCFACNTLHSFKLILLGIIFNDDSKCNSQFTRFDWLSRPLRVIGLIYIVQFELWAQCIRHLYSANQPLDKYKQLAMNTTLKCSLDIISLGTKKWHAKNQL